MSLVVTFIILTSIGMAISFLLNRRFEIMMPIAVLAIIVVLYLFGIIGFLRIGINLIYVIFALSFIWCIYYIIKNRKEFLSKDIFIKIITPGFVIYILLFILVWWAHRGRIVFYGDEVTHWALVVKNMNLFDALGSIPESSVGSKSYPPAIALFQYLWVDIGQIVYGRFLDENIYRGINILYFILVLPLFKNIDWNNYKKSLVLLGFILFIPLIFFETFYHKLQVDAILGVFSAYALLSYYNNEFDYLQLVNLCLCIFVISLIKVPSIVFSLIIVTIIIADMLIFSRKKLKPSNKIKTKKLIRLSILLLLICLIVSPLSWMMYTRAVDEPTIQSTETIIDIEATQDRFIGKIENVLKLNLPDYTKNTISQMWKAMQTREYGIDGNFMRVTIFSSLLLMLFFSIVFLSMIKKEQQFTRIKTSISFVYLGWMAYVFARLAIYLTAHSQYVAELALSLTRYIGSYLQMMVIFIFGLFLDKCYIKSNVGNRVNTIVMLSLVSIFLLTGFTEIADMTIFAKASNHKSIVDMNRLGYAESIIDKIDHNDDTVYFISSDIKLISVGLVSIPYFVSCYQLVPNKLSKTRIASRAPITNKVRYPSNIGREPRNNRDGDTVPYTIEQWEAILYNGFTHVYIYAADKQFIKEYGALFENTGDIQENTLFIVEEYDGSVVLVKID